MRVRIPAIVSTLLLTASITWAQDQPGHDMSKMSAKPDKGGMAGTDTEDGAHAMHSMEGHHVDMGPHMKMTALRDPKPGDEKRAQQVVDAARHVAEKYKDYHIALADNFQIFLPNVPQKMYHFTNYSYAFEAAVSFNPEHPTSLLYEKHGDDYTLVGVMYTAPKRFDEDDLDQRIPLSIAQWHEHVNLCLPPADGKKEAFGPHAKFGMQGSIATKGECDASGGTFRPLVFNWMVHLYPLEKTEGENLGRGPRPQPHPRELTNRPRGTAAPSHSVGETCLMSVKQTTHDVQLDRAFFVTSMDN
jgi:hypothetical protein